MVQSAVNDSRPVPSNVEEIAEGESYISPWMQALSWK